MTQRPSPSSAQIALAQRDIGARYRSKARRKRYGRRPRTIAAIRIAELTRLFDYRWGNVLLPDTDEGAAAARIMAHHIGALPDAPRRIGNWLMTCTPWMRLADRERLISEVTECPLRWSADKLAWKLRLSDAERSILRISTIGAFDVTKAERAERRAANKRERERHRRRQSGAAPRAKYLARGGDPPWVIAGLSRATWYRRKMQLLERETRSVPSISISILLDTDPVSRKFEPREKRHGEV